MWRVKMWVICFWGDKRRVQVPLEGEYRRDRINETTVICFSHTVRWDETPAACSHTLLQSFCISQGCSMRSGCREELCHYHRNAPLCAFVLWIISIILLANTCDSSSWGISWIHSAIFFFFWHGALPPPTLISGPLRLFALYWRPCVSGCVQSSILWDGTA